MLRIVALFLLASSPALAQGCPKGSESLLSVTSWNVVKVDGVIPGDPSGVDITVKVQSRAGSPIRMIDASYTFEDALGRRISSFEFDPDLAIKPGETVETGTGYAGSEMDRVPSMAAEDIRVFTCTFSVIYSDGTKEEFQ